MHIRLIALNSRYVHSCPALFYVRNELAKHLPASQPDIVQFTINDPYYATLLRIIEGEPYALFFSVYIWNSHYIHLLIQDLSRILPRALIVLGGPQAPHILYGTNSSDLFGRGGCTVIRGEIEGAPSSFYNDLAAGCLKAEYICRPGRDFSFPYRQDDFVEALRDRHLYYESSRGCPFSCSYCLSAVSAGVRYKDFERVRQELTRILAHEPKMVRFVDRTFNDRPERALAVWRFLAEQGENTLFHFEIVPDRLTEEMFSFLKTLQPDQFQFEIGVQSTHPETLTAINRRMDIEKARDNISRLATLNTVYLHVDLIIGLPHETAEIFSRSFDDVFRSSPHYIQMGLLKILPEAPINRSLEEFGMVRCENPPYEVLATKWLDQKDLAELFWVGRCVESFYNNRFFTTIWAYVKRSGGSGFEFFRALLEICRQNSFFQRAPTQERMSLMLLKLADQRQDRKILRELLAFDWLQSGHRYLPEHLQVSSLPEIKRRLRERLEQNCRNLYDHHSRNAFFKQSVFAYFSGEALRETGLGQEDRGGYVCFLPQELPGVLKHKQAVVILPER